MSKYMQVIIGSALLAVAAITFLPSVPFVLTALGWSVFGGLGSSMLLSGIGTLLSKGPLEGLSTAARNPTASWSVVYGRSRPGGAVLWTDKAA